MVPPSLDLALYQVLDGNLGSDLDDPGIE